MDLTEDSRVALEVQIASQLFLAKCKAFLGGPIRVGGPENMWIPGCSRSSRSITKS